MINNIILILILAAVILLELASGRSMKPLFKFQNNLLLCFWLSIVFQMIKFFLQYYRSESLAFIAAITLVGILADFFLAVYLIFRGIPLLFSLSKEGPKHPTIVTIKKLSNHRVFSLLFVTIFVMICHASEIYHLYLQLISNQA